MTDVPTNSSEEWDGIFSRLEGNPGDEDPWLERWRGLLEAHRGSPVLDLGCGAGHDARTLTRWGHPVIAADFSAKALKLTRRRAPGAEVRDLDLVRRLRFSDDHFGVVVAGLSLHYFPRRQTVEILEEVRRCLIPGGHLLARLNSTNDPHYAAARKQEIEENLYVVDGSPKRLFDRKTIVALLPEGWELTNATERTTTRYGSQKTLWEIAAKKIPADG